MVAFADGRGRAALDATASLVSADSPARREVITVSGRYGRNQPAGATAAPSPGVEPLAGHLAADRHHRRSAGDCALRRADSLRSRPVSDHPDGSHWDLRERLPVVITQNGVDANATTLPVR